MRPEEDVRQALAHNCWMVRTCEEGREKDPTQWLVDSLNQFKGRADALAWVLGEDGVDP